MRQSELSTIAIVNELIASIAAGAVTLTGDATGSGTGTFSTSVVKIKGNTVPVNAAGALTNDGSGNLTWTPPSGSGTVTSVSIVSTNGFAGSVATSTTTPAITITTTITGVLKGNGTSVSAATDGTDYLSPTTGIKNGATSTLSAVTTITSNAANQWIQNGAFTAGANNDIARSHTGTITSRNTASDVLVSDSWTPNLTLNAGAPASVVLISQLNNPTFTSGVASTSSILARHIATVNNFLLFEIRNSNAGSSADTRLRVGNDTSPFQFQTIVNSSTNSALGGAGSTNLITNGLFPLTLGTNGNVRHTISSTGNNTFAQSSQSANHAFFTLTQAAHTAGVPNFMVQTGGAHTAITAGSEMADITYNFNRTLQWASNTNITLQRTMTVNAPTITFASATGTVTTAVNTQIGGAPIAGTNAAITTAIALRVTGNAVGSGTTTSYGIFAEPNTGATTNHGIGTSGNIVMTTAGNKLFVKEGTDGSVGQTTLVSGTKAITINGVTTATRAIVTFVSVGGTVTTTWQYAAVCTSNTLTITALTNAGATNTSDTSILNYFIVQPAP
jgi:hypothetical protein